MTLRQKVLLLTGFALVVVVVVMYFLASQILVNGFTALEKEQVSECVHRVQSALSDDLAQLNTKALEWSSSPELPGFIRNGNEEFRRSRASGGMLSTLGLNLMLLLDSSGKVVHAVGFDSERQCETELSAATIQLLTTNSTITVHENAQSLHSGVALLTEGPMLLVVRPVPDSQGNKDVCGTVMFGQLLNAETIRRVGQVSGLGLAVRRMDDRRLSGDFKTARVVLSRGEAIWIRNVSRHRVAGYVTRDDLFGQPSLLMEVMIPRNIFVQGQVMTGYLLSSLVAVCLVLGLGSQWGQRWLRFSQCVFGIRSQHQKRQSLLFPERRRAHTDLQQC